MNELARWFDSVETDRPFTSCKVCDLPLPLTSDSWIVNKHYHHNECILEYAVCEACRDLVSNSFSDDSKAAIRKFLETEINWEDQLLEWMKLTDSSERLDNCVACKVPRGITNGFTISAQFTKEGTLIENALPLLMCDSCISKITESLSESSRITWQKFIAEYFEGPENDTPNLGLF